jgi:hypothetical protein
LILSSVRILTLICVFSYWLVAVARADDATKLFDEGQTLKEAGNLKDACVKFAQSYDIDRKANRPAPGTQLNLADCAEREGQFRKAYLLYDDAARAYDARAKAAEGNLAKVPNSVDAKRDLERASSGAKFAREHAQTVSLKLGKVVVRIAEPGIDGLAIRIGDRAVPAAAEIVEFVDAGSVQITATAPGRDTFTTDAVAQAGQQVVVQVTFKAGAVATKPPVDTTPRPGRKKSRVRLAYGLGGGGVLLIGVSSILGLSANSQYDKAAKNCATIGGNLECPGDRQRW